MDDYRAQMNRVVGGRGIHCDCCNLYRRNHNGNKKNKRHLNHIARQSLKRIDKRVSECMIQEWESEA